MPDLNNIKIFGQTVVLNMGLISSFGYIDYVPPPGSYNPTLIVDAMRLLVEQFENKDDLHNFFQILLNPQQEIEAVLGQMLRLKSILLGAADRLDIAGAIVGEPRLFRTDDEYRAAIYIRIFLNKSSGEPPAIIAAIRAATGASRIFYNERYPFGIDLCFTSTYELSKNLQILIEGISMGGVFIILGMSNDNSLDSIAFPEGGFPDVANTGAAAEEGFPDPGDGAAMEVWDFSE